MSTYWYFQCITHDPPMRSDDCFTGHTDDQYFARAIELAHQRPLEYRESAYMPGSGAAGQYENAATRFLLQHPRCLIGLVDENGNTRDLPPTPVQQLAEELFRWNTPNDPYFVIRGRADDDDIHEPYEVIAQAIVDRFEVRPRKTEEGDVR